VLDDNADSSPRAGTNNNLEKCGLGAPKIGGDGKDSWERVVDGDCYLTGRLWYHDQLGMSLHPAVRMEGPTSRKVKSDSVNRIPGDEEFPG
jgi:hypothetical protein